MSSKPRSNTAQKILAVCAVVTLLFLIGTKFCSSPSQSPKTDEDQIVGIDSEDENFDFNLINDHVVYGIGKVPILDGNIFIGIGDFSKLIIGGVNIDLVKIAAKTNLGEAVEIKHSSINDYYAVDSKRGPILQIEYKKLFFEITLENKDGFPHLSIIDINEATMTLFPITVHRES